MKIISWNLNGIRAAVRKGLLSFISKENADIYCFQEIKAQENDIDLDLSGYQQFWNSAAKRGKSGTLVLSKIKPQKIIYKIGARKIDNDGRLIILDFQKFYLINAYFPHAGWGLKQLDYKINFNNKIGKMINKFRKPVIIAADFNVAHKEIDLAKPKQNYGNAMFTREERNWFDQFLKSGYIDAFRIFNYKGGNYTWWSYRKGVRERNIGWRIDYFLVSKRLKNKVKKSNVLRNVTGSDHCPIRLKINI